MRYDVEKRSIERFRIVAAGVLAFAVALAALVEPAAAASDRQLKKTLKKADKHWQEGQAEAALGLYESVLAGTERGAPERAGALYAVAVACLAPKTEWHDPLRARKALQELAEAFPRHPRTLEIQALTSLAVAEVNAATRTAELERQLASLRAASTEGQQTNEALGTELEDLREQLAAAERRLAAQRRELAATQEELARKEEALAKLTERLVGRSGDG